MSFVRFHIELLYQISLMIVLFHFQFTEDPVVVIQISRIHVVYDVEERIVRYASANVAVNRDSTIMIASSDPELPHINQQFQQEHYRQHEYHQQNENVENQRPPCNNCQQVTYIYLLDFFLFTIYFNQMSTFTTYTF